MLRNRRSLSARQREMRKRQPARRGPGRPPLPIDAEQVERLARFGHSLEEIAVLLKCCPNTLRNRFREQIEWGHVWLDALVTQISFQMALQGNRQALMFHIRLRGLFGTRPPRLRRRRRRNPRSVAPEALWRRGRTYQPFRNRYRAGRKARFKPRPSAPAPPSPLAPTPPKPRRPWTASSSSVSRPNYKLGHPETPPAKPCLQSAAPPRPAPASLRPNAPSAGERTTSGARKTGLRDPRVNRPRARGQAALGLNICAANGS